MFEIEKGIEIPKPIKGGSKYPWKKIEVGDSFFIPATTIKIRSAQTMSGQGNIRYKPKKFTSRTCINNGIVGVRIWRIE